MYIENERVAGFFLEERGGCKSCTFKRIKGRNPYIFLNFYVFTFLLLLQVVIFTHGSHTLIICAHVVFFSNNEDFDIQLFVQLDCSYSFFVRFILLVIDPWLFFIAPMRHKFIRVFITEKSLKHLFQLFSDK